MAKYKMASPRGLPIKNIQAEDIRLVHDILKGEGCPESENLFDDKQWGIALDGIQKRTARRHHALPSIS